MVPHLREMEEIHLPSIKALTLPCASSGGRCPKKTDAARARWVRPVSSQTLQRQNESRLTVHRSCSSHLIRCLSCGRRDNGSGGSSSPEWSNQDSRTAVQKKETFRVRELAFYTTAHYF